MTSVVSKGMYVLKFLFMFSAFYNGMNIKATFQMEEEIWTFHLFDCTVQKWGLK